MASPVMYSEHRDPVAPKPILDQNWFEIIPTELILKIMEMMTPRDLSNLAFVNKHVYEIFRGNQATIMATVLKNRPEIEIMLYLYTAESQDFAPGRMLHPRTIDFDPEQDSKCKINLLRASVSFNEGKLVCPEKIELKILDIIVLWKWIMVIDWWVELYPTLRWRDHPEDRRCLRTEEEVRLRKAVARWWLYANYFHGVYWRDVSVPRKWQNDKRLHHLRILSTREICELEDLWGLMFDTISRDLCSSPERVRIGENYYGVDLVPWGAEEGRHHNIVNTYMKLDPEQLKYFLELYCHRKKTDVIKAVSNSLRKFDLDRETLSLSINTVLEERMMLKPNEITNLSRSGIVDEDRDDGKQSDIWCNDACPTGKPPISQAQINAFPTEYEKRVPQGDDGSDEPY